MVRLDFSPSSRRLLVALGVLTGFALLSIGCGKGDQQPVTAQTSKFQVAAGNSPTGPQASTLSSDAAAGSSEPSSLEPREPVPKLPKPPSRPPINSKQGAAGSVRTPNDSAGSAGGRDADPDAASGRAPRRSVRLTPDTIPDGTPDELLTLLDLIEQEGPEGRTNRELLESLQLWLQNRLAITNKLLASDASEKQRLRAAQAKRETLVQMIQAGFPDVEKQILGFCRELQDDKSPKLVRLGRLTDLQLNLAVVMSGGTQETDAIEASIEAVLSIEPEDEEVFQTVVTAAVQLQSAGLTDAALTTHKAIQNRFGKSENERITAILVQLADLTKIIELKFDPLRRAVATDEPDSSAPFLEAVGKLLDGTPGEVILEQLANTAQELEASRHYEIAAKLYEQLDAAFKNHPNAEVGKKAAAKITRGQRRAKLVGEPLTVEGTLLNGKPIDWKTYEGKVVLVSFWVTTFQPCREELPNLKRNYDRYHKQGFEIIGVNLDREPGDVEQFFSVQSLPWASVVNGQELAEKCGIESILPFTILIGRDGKVTDLHMRGDYLSDRLAKIFEPDVDADQPAPTKPAESKAAAAEQPAPAKPAAEKPAAAKSAPADAPEADAPAAEKSAPAKKSADGQSSHFVPSTQFGRGFAAADEPAQPAPTRRTPSSGRQATTGAAAPAKPSNAPGDVPANAEQKAEAEVNPYLAKQGLKPAELVDFLLNMQEKPKSIQSRPGFTAAIVDAADRVLAAETTDKFRGIAADAKIDALHKQASLGDKLADEQLNQLVNALQDKPIAAVTDKVKFLQLERQVVQSSDLPLEKIPDLLTQVKKFCADEKLEARHLRLASSTVEAINRLENDDAREKEFAEFGKLFAKSSDKELARYGKKLAKAPPGKDSELVGKPLELIGTTASGAPFDWKTYRGKVVIVDFWATWCGPCVREMPNVKAIYEKHKDRGFDIVGVSLDQDLDALAEFIQKNQIPWQSLSGDGTQDLAQKYGVRGIPTVMLVDREGNVVAVTHRIDQLVPELEKMLAK